MLDQIATPRLARSTALRYFAEVATKGSFRAAAESLNIAPSAVNRQVTNLEHDLGIKLFERARGRSGLRLTDAGRILQFRVRAALNELYIANDEINALQGLQRGHVIIGVNEGLATNLIPRAVRSFNEQYPSITYTILVDNTRRLVSRLRAGEIDFAVGYNFPTNTDLRFVEKLSLKMFLITARDHPLSKLPNVTISDLNNVNLVLPDSSLLLRQTFDVALSQSDALIRPIIETNSFDLIYALVGIGIGVGIVTGRTDEVMGRNNVEYVEISDVLLSSNVLACCHLPNRSLSIAAQTLMNTICAILRKSGDMQQKEQTEALSV